jgi:PAS domain S-box-containing protein
MNLAQKIIHALEYKFSQFSLRGKISFVLISSVSMVCGLVMLASYISTHYLILNYTHELLNSKAELGQRELEIRLAAEIQSATEFSNNFITANALADTQESELYLAPFLKNQKHVFAGTGFTVADYRGRSIASNLNQKPYYGNSVTYAAMMQSGKAQIQVQENDRQEKSLVIALPVQYRLTNQIEGGVVLDIPLKSMLLTNANDNFHWLVDDSGAVIAGKQPDSDDVIVSSEHAVRLPFGNVHLKYYLARDRGTALQKIDALLAGYLGIALAAIAGLLIFARFSARYISGPLEYLSKIAHEITSSGRPQSRIHIDSKDEYGALAQAFNTMFARLSDIYEDLEARVKARTSELENARNLLHEAVGSTTHGFCIFDQQDRLLVFNEAYREYSTLGDFLEAGRTYNEILSRVADGGAFEIPAAGKQQWIRERLAHHLKADASPFELKRRDGRWYMAQEIRSPSGYIIGTRIEITELKNVTNALTQRELYLRATLDNLPFLFWLKDDQSRFLAVNKTYSDACGLARPEDAVGKTDFDIWPVNLAEKYQADDFEVISSQHEKQVEESMQASNGTTWIETYKKPVVAADGKVMGTVGFSRDISDRKRVELALAEAEMRWSLAMRGANDGIWHWNLITDKVYFSERWKSMLGFAQDEIGDTPDEWAARVHPDDHDRALALVNAHLQGKSEFYSCEHRLRCKDGSYKWVLTRGKAFIDEQGKPLSISGSHTDISEMKIAEAIIMDRTQQLDAIFALSPDGFVSFDQNYHFKYANPAFYQLTNLDAEKLNAVSEDEFSKQLAQQCKDNARFVGVAALRAKLSLAHNKATDNAMSREDIDGQVIELATAGNRLLEVSLRLSKAPTVTEILYVRDVTYEVEVSRIKSEFLSTAAHELRTPMSSIFGYSELLLSRQFDTEQQRNFHQIIHKQAALVSEILNELLDLQRIESRRGKDFVFAKLDIGQLISETIAMYKVPADRGAPLVSLPANSCFVKADRSKMIQVINNVLSNAYKYSPNGGDVEIEVSENGERTDAGFIGIKIKDHGMGLTPEQLARVCERFYRADSSGAVPGTGLGMSIVKEIVELHNGHVEMASQHGKGTVVTLWLPIDVTD